LIRRICFVRVYAAAPHKLLQNKTQLFGERTIWSTMSDIYVKETLDERESVGFVTPAADPFGGLHGDGEPGDGADLSYRRSIAGHICASRAG
jgi:hypothetical protein